MLLKNINRKFVIINNALASLHGRSIFDAFGIYFAEIINDLDHMVINKLVTGNLDVIDYKNTLLLPTFSLKGTKRLNITWVYFVFIYASHKAQNIKQRNRSKQIDLLYLRGFDATFTAELGELCTTGYSMVDTLFQSNVLYPYMKNFNIVKVLSETDLRWIMNGIGSHFSRNGYNLLSVASYASFTNSGIYLNTKHWKERVSDLMDSSSLFFVHISNNSESLLFELESLLEKKLEKHTIIFINNDWKTQRETVIKSQESIKDYVKWKKFEVNDYKFNSSIEEKIQMLMNQFPHRFKYDVKYDEKFHNNLLTLSNDIKRNVQIKRQEIPFDFHINLNSKQKKEVDELQMYVSIMINSLIKDPTKLNLVPLKSFLEMDVFLNLIFGRVKMASLSMVKYKALCDFSLKLAKKKKIELSQNMKNSYKQNSNTSKTIAKQALKLGDWNEYENNFFQVLKTFHKTRLDTKYYLEQKINKNQKCILYNPKDIKQKNNYEMDFLTDEIIKMIMKISSTQK